MDIGCIDVPHFPAWAVRWARRPEGPVSVLARGRVMAAGPLARRMGIGAGRSAEEVRSAAPDGLILPRQPAEEKLAWAALLDRLHTLTPRIEPDVPGRAYFRPPPDRNSLKRLATDLGLRIGLAPRRSYAYLTALAAEPGTVRYVAEDQLAGFLTGYPVQWLRRAGFPEELIQRLVQFSFRQLGPLRRLTHRHLRAQFGKEGERLHRLLHPEDEPAPIPLFQPPERLERTYDVERPHRPGTELPSALEHMLGRLGEELAGRRCQRLVLQIEARPWTPPATRLLREPLRVGPALRRHATRLLDEFTASSPERIDALTVTLGALSTPEREQGRLFERRPPLLKALEAVDARFPGMLLRPEIIPDALFEEDAVTFVPLTADESTPPSNRSQMG